MVCDSDVSGRSQVARGAKPPCVIWGAFDDAPPTRETSSTPTRSVSEVWALDGLRSRRPRLRLELVWVARISGEYGRILVSPGLLLFSKTTRPIGQLFEERAFFTGVGRRNLRNWASPC
jgi:hypothetical protein